LIEGILSQDFSSSRGGRSGGGGGFGGRDRRDDGFSRRDRDDGYSRRDRDDYGGGGGGFGRERRDDGYSRRDRDDGYRRDDYGDRGGRRQGGGGGGFGGGGFRGGESETIYVESTEVGRIIGKKGSRIQEMERDSGCRIKVSKDGDSRGQVPVELQGEKSAISEAKRMIEDAGVNISDNSRGW